MKWKIISNQQIEGFSPKKKSGTKAATPMKMIIRVIISFFHRSPGLPISPSHCVVHRPQHFQGDHPAVLHTNQAISTPAFNMSWPFCTVRVVSLAKCCNCLSTCVFRRIRRWECGAREAAEDGGTLSGVP